MGIFQKIIDGFGNVAGGLLGWNEQEEAEKNRRLQQQIQFDNYIRAKEMNSQNLAYARENRDYYNEVNTANRMIAAGYNPNLINMSPSSAQPAFRAQSLPDQQAFTSNDAQIRRAALTQLWNEIKDSYYSFKIKKEEYLSKKEDRERKNDAEGRAMSLFLQGQSERDVENLLWHSLYDSMHETYHKNGGIAYRVDEFGNPIISKQGREIIDEFISNYRAVLGKQLIQNANTEQRTSNLIQYRNNLEATEDRVRQQVAAGRISESEGYQILKVILEIIKSLK